MGVKVLWTLISSALVLPVVAKAHLPFDAGAACTAIVKSYSACYSGMSYDSRTGDVTLSPYTSRVRCSDGLKLSFYDRLERMDFASMLSIPYAVGDTSLPNKVVNSDGGRLRLDQMFFEVYGGSLAEVQRNLVNVRILNQQVKFNSKNGAAAALSSVGVDLMRAVKSDRAVASYLKPWLTGKIDLARMTFAWRKVAGTDRFSNHSFGTAIDFNNLWATGPVYWLWEVAKKRQAEIERRTGRKPALEKILKTINERSVKDFKPTTLDPVPRKIVEIFERHGFIWGGKWYHFDTMHFEFRPEFFKNLRPVCRLLTAEEDTEPLQEINDETSEEMQTLLDHHHFD